MKKFDLKDTDINSNLEIKNNNNNYLKLEGEKLKIENKKIEG